MEDSSVMNGATKMEEIVSLCKRRGFIYQGSEIYGGLAGTYDYGPLGVALKQNIESAWWRFFVTDREDMYGVDTAILMNSKVWEASGHLSGFTDPLVEDLKTKKTYRADHLIENAGLSAAGLTSKQMSQLIEEKEIKSPDGNLLGEAKNFNLLFPTRVGAVEDSSSTVYLRGELAQGMFVNFKNILDSMHPKLPFGIAHVGKAFRNEIAPRDFTFRSREFNLMEFEYFIDPEKGWEKIFNDMYNRMYEWIDYIGINRTQCVEIEKKGPDLAHYSKRTIDIEFLFPFGQKELYGIAYRTDFDLSQHEKHSGVSMKYRDEETSRSFVPHVIEPTFGIDRTILAVLSSAYTEDDLGGEKRVYLKFKPSIAPVLCAVSPLLKNKPELVAKAREVFGMLKKEFGRVMFDDNGNIGKRYRRQDEIGTPFCIVVDFETIEGETVDTVTIRHRDTGTQERVAIKDLISKIKTLSE